MILDLTQTLLRHLHESVINHIERSPSQDWRDEEDALIVNQAESVLMRVASRCKKVDQAFWPAKLSVSVAKPPADGHGNQDAVDPSLDRWVQATRT